MGRSICVEEKIEKTVESFYKEPWAIGLIIGQLTPQKDYVIHLARTPSIEEDVAQQKDDATKRKTKKHTSLDTVDEHWVSIHASQVIRMLPGGLDVVGVFAVGPPDMMQAAQAKLRQVLFAAHKTLWHGQREPNMVSPGITDRILLQICSVSRKITCRTFDVANPKCSARPADWKYQAFLSRWRRLDSTMSIDWVIPVDVASLCDTLTDQIQNGLVGFCKNVWGSLATIDGRILPAEAVLTNQSPQTTTTQHAGKRRKQKVGQSTTDSPQRHAVALFAQMSEGGEVPQATIVECGAQMLVRGNISSRAFVHAKATVAEATQAVKTDIIRSLTFRCQLLCEDLLQAEEEQDPKVLYETPIRVFAPVADTPLSMCDYMFQGEATTDSMERFRELLDLVVEPDTIELDAERIPSEEDVAKSEEFDLESIDDNENPTSSSNLGRIGLVASGAVVFLAAGMSYYYMGGGE